MYQNEWGMGCCCRVGYQACHMSCLINNSPGEFKTEMGVLEAKCDGKISWSFYQREQGPPHPILPEAAGQTG